MNRHLIARSFLVAILAATLSLTTGAKSQDPGVATVTPTKQQSVTAQEVIVHLENKHYIG